MAAMLIKMHVDNVFCSTLLIIIIYYAITLYTSYCMVFKVML